jgi:hypothetical protein
VDSLEASAVDCPNPLTLTWTTTNAESVDVAIEDPDGIYASGPANGSMEVPAPCDGDSQTYYVTAIGEDGATDTQELTLS